MAKLLSRECVPPNFWRGMRSACMRYSTLVLASKTASIDPLKKQVTDHGARPSSFDPGAVVCSCHGFVRSCSLETHRGGSLCKDFAVGKQLPAHDIRSSIARESWSQWSDAIRLCSSEPHEPESCKRDWGNLKEHTHSHKTTELPGSERSELTLVSLLLDNMMLSQSDCLFRKRGQAKRT